MFMSLDEKFLAEVSKCRDPIQFIGLARVLRINPFTEKDGIKDFKDFNSLLAEVLFSFKTLERSRKRELLKILKNANKIKNEVPSATNSVQPTKEFLKNADNS